MLVQPVAPDGLLVMVCRMIAALRSVAARFRQLSTHLLVRLGFQQDSFLLLLALAVGILTAAAAVSFHWLIHEIRDLLVAHADPGYLYGRSIYLLVVWPALGGLLVGALGRWVFRAREGHGIIDVIESIVRSSGFQRPAVAIEKIITSAITIGSGGSAGAEGPIVQIGAAIASGVGQLFQISRQQMPLLIGCGSAAGISAIFNAPIGGVLFTLEVIMQDFSIRTLVPVVVASVLSNMTTQAIFTDFLHEPYEAIFAMPAHAIAGQMDLTGRFLPGFIMLGIACGLVGVLFIRSMLVFERFFAGLKVPRLLRPGIGGAAVGLLGVAYIMLFAWTRGIDKPIEFSHYPLPAFFSDGYGAIQQLLAGDFYSRFSLSYVVLLLAVLCLAKVLATSLTLSSGGSGGVIAPALFMGATLGGLIGVLLQHLPWLPHAQPQIYALIGLAATLAAVVHAPLSSVLILLELTHDYKLLMPGMFATVIATGLARILFRDSIYTHSLRERGIRPGAVTDVLSRLFVEQVDLEPAATVHPGDSLQKLLDMGISAGTSTFVVVNAKGLYVAMIRSEDLHVATLEPEFSSTLIAQDVMQESVPTVTSHTDLATVLQLFSTHDVSHLAVCMPAQPGRIIGLISRVGLMRRYQKAVA